MIIKERKEEAQQKNRIQLNLKEDELRKAAVLTL